jgi:hypothetical protein
MKKPKKETREYYDYSKCAKFIAYKLGVKDLRDFAGKYEKGGENKPYLDFWHWLCDMNDVHNGCYIYMPPASDIPNYSEDEKWVAPIVQAFEDEFGEEAEMWVDW